MNEGELQTTVRWHNSLIVRVMAMCAVLVACLLGAVYAISIHYSSEVVREMEDQLRTIADEVQLEVAEQPNADYSALAKELSQKRGTPIVLQSTDEVEQSSVTMHMEKDGTLTKVGQYSFKLGDVPVRVTATVNFRMQTELMRALRNKYVATVLLVFLATLALMIYFIGRTLRPLRELSETCAQIGAGNLRNVEVRRNAGEVLALEQTFNHMVQSLRDKELMERNLRQAQRLSALGTLAAGVAHDVRNPLNAIKLLSGHALDTVQELDGGSAAARQIETIRNEVNRLEEIVSGFLSLAKERELQPEPCLVDGLLSECAHLIKPDAEAREVRLITELRAGGAEVMADPKQLRRAVLNVLINAVEACRPGGRVRLYSRLTDDHCEIEIRDDGPGMSQETADHAFDPYFTTKKTGTGLGLSITRGIIEEHGGTIALDSQEELGCQALICLPLRK